MTIDKDFGIIENCRGKAIITQWKSWEQYIEDIRTGGKNQELILKLRKLDKKTQRKEYDRIKYQISLTTSPNFKDNHCTNDNYLGNDWMPLDIDNLTPKQIIEFKKRICGLPYVICCYLSCGGKGLRVIIKIPFVANDKEYKAMFATVEKEINSLLDIEIDTTCKDSRRLSFDSLDPDVYHNPNATEFEPYGNGALDWSSEISKDYKVKEPVRMDERIKRYIDVMPLAVSGNGGHATTFTVAMALVEGFGLSIAEAMKYMQYYNSKLSEKWTEKELLHKLEDAAKKIDSSKLGNLNNSNLPQVSVSSASKTTEQQTEVLVELPEPEDILEEASLLSVPKFDSNILPEGCDSFVKDSSNRMQSPPDFIGIPLMIFLSVMVAYKINIRPKVHDIWTVVVNLWGVIIGLPSTMKTPSIDESKRFIKAIDAKANEEYKEKCKEYKIQKKVEEQSLKIIDGKAKQILTGNKEEYKHLTLEERKERVAKLYEENEKSQPEPPIRKRYLLGDSSIERRQEIQAENAHRAMCITRDELPGFINKLDATGKENDRAYLLESWSGNSDYINDTVSRNNTYVPNNTQSVVGGAQPAKWQRVVSDTVYSTQNDDGFPQRFQLAVQPDISSELWEIVDKHPDYKAINKVSKIFEYLDEITPEQVNAKEDHNGNYYLNFTQEAQKLFYKWWTEHENWLKRDKELPVHLNSHFYKYKSLVPSIALIIHLSEFNVGDVGINALKKAIKWSEYLKAHAYRIYGEVLPLEEQTAKLIAEKIVNKKLGDKFTIRTLYRKHWSGITKETAEAGLKILEEAGWGQLKEEKTNGRPINVFYINPKVFLKYIKNDSSLKHKVPKGTKAENISINTTSGTYGTATFNELAIFEDTKSTDTDSLQKEINDDSTPDLTHAEQEALNVFDELVV